MSNKTPTKMEAALTALLNLEAPAGTPARLHACVDILKSICPDAVGAGKVVWLNKTDCEYQTSVEKVNRAHLERKAEYERR